jgi:Rrf2 family transcriptional regulator, iron-sulfur cluster assembly transcription factor
MMSLSQSTGYAINALACVSEQKGQPVLIRDIAKGASVPRAYLAKLLAKLAGAGLVQSKRGLRGGVRLARDPGAISIYEIMEAIDGPEALSQCLLGMAVCSDERACPTHEFWTAARKRIEIVLREMTLSDVSSFQRKIRNRRPRARRTRPKASRCCA